MASPETPFISIILPTYNRREMLGDCIKSVTSQTYPNWELVIIDDGSDLDIHSTVSRFLCHNVRYYKNVNRRGLPGARNVGITVSRYDYVLFIEDDMILNRDALELLVSGFLSVAAKNIRIGAIAPSIPAVTMKGSSISRINVTNKVDNRPGPYSVDKFTGLMHVNFNPEYRALQEVTGLHACTLYLKKALLEVRGYDESSYKGNFLREESDLNYRISTLGYKLYFEPRSIFYHVRVVNGGCRTGRVRGNYYYVKNHMIYVLKNYRFKSLYMLPIFIIYVLINGLVLPFRKMI